MAIIKNCSWCGKEIKIPPSKNSKNNFCNRECYSKFHSKNKDTTIYICEVCGKNFQSKNKENANRFCSRECYNTFHKIKNKNRICPVCGKSFEARTSDSKYCSQECHLKSLHSYCKGENHWNWQGGLSKENDRHDSQEYKEWRKKVYEKDNYCCVKCGSKNKLNAHHILSWKHYPELRYNVANGNTLCEKCHIEIHKKYGYDSKEKMV